MRAPSIPPNSIPVVRQLEDWASKNGVMLFPRVYPFTTITGTNGQAFKTLQPDGAFIIVGFPGLTFDEPSNKVNVDQIYSGGRKIVDGGGTLRLAAFINLLESDGIFAGYLPAHIAVYPGDTINYQVSCDVAGDTLANASGNNYETSALGYALHDVKTGAQLGEARCKELLDKLLADLGELRILGLAGSAAAIDASASPAVPMSVEVLATQGIAPATTTNARLTIGNYEVCPPGFTLPPASFAFRCTGLALNPGTITRLRVNAGGSVRAHVALAGRRLG